jgi:hypothetical protein
MFDVAVTTLKAGALQNTVTPETLFVVGIPSNAKVGADVNTGVPTMLS